MAVLSQFWVHDMKEGTDCIPTLTCWCQPKVVLKSIEEVFSQKSFLVKHRGSD